MTVCSIDGCGRPDCRRGWCSTHYRRWLRYGDPAALARWQPIRDWREAVVESPEGGCLIWQRSTSAEGYGRWRGGYAHRLVYESEVGPIPAGLTIDHLCRNPSCVNPAHLEPVTIAENLRRSPGVISSVRARQTHCVHGHAFDVANTRINSEGSRTCRACDRIRRAAAYQRRVADRGRVKPEASAAPSPVASDRAGTGRPIRASEPRFERARPDRATE